MGKLQARIKEKTEEGYYIITEETDTTLLSPFSVMERANGDIRILQDLSYPENRGLNAFAEKGNFSVRTLKVC